MKSAALKADFASSVFINCPFDQQYKPFLRAAVFAIFDCGYQPRCAQEVEDGGEVRIEKIRRIIAQCKFGLHDISRTELAGVLELPRFNMPFELGIFLGARYFGDSEQSKKVCLIVDSDRYRYQAALSDIAGQDIQSHDNSYEILITKIRNWLANATARSTIPGAARIRERFASFQNDLPAMCAELQWDMDELLFNEFSSLASAWLRTHDQRA